ncbi:unnamed protein product [Macrosiphum euphorbiae]|uniref:Uncharacterized protein n=1 Tax=Macrosiphum euphorbiae TaxID=13131 RepID=A0AAV0W1W1_9HEMI|nr:unnamed protein product [Macrosiphum euphorbiae]
MGPTAEAASQRPATRLPAAGRARVLKRLGNRNSLAFAVHYLIVDQMGFSFIFKNKQISFYFLINNCSYNTNIYDVYNTDII